MMFHPSTPCAYARTKVPVQKFQSAMPTALRSSLKLHSTVEPLIMYVIGETSLVTWSRHLLGVRQDGDLWLEMLHEFPTMANNLSASRLQARMATL